MRESDVCAKRFYSNRLPGEEVELLCANRPILRADTWPRASAMGFIAEIDSFGL